MPKRGETARRPRDPRLRVIRTKTAMVIIRGRLAPEVGAVVIQALTRRSRKRYISERARSTDGSSNRRTRWPS